MQFFTISKTHFLKPSASPILNIKTNPQTTFTKLFWQNQTIASKPFNLHTKSNNAFRSYTHQSIY